MRNFKIRNSNKTLVQTARIQTALFELGFTWHDGSRYAEYLYAVGYSVRYGKIWYQTSHNGFDLVEQEEITLHQLEAMVQEKRAEDSSPGCETAQAILGENLEVVPLDGIDYEKKIWVDVYTSIAALEGLPYKLQSKTCGGWADQALEDYRERFPKTKKR